MCLYGVIICGLCRDRNLTLLQPHKKQECEYHPETAVAIVLDLWCNTDPIGA